MFFSNRFFSGWDVVCRSSHNFLYTQNIFFWVYRHTKRHWWVSPRYGKVFFSYRFFGRFRSLKSSRPLVGFHSERLWKIAWCNAETLQLENDAAPIQNQKKLNPLDPRKDENLFGTFHVTTLIPGASRFRTSGCVQRLPSCSHPAAKMTDPPPDP